MTDPFDALRRPDGRTEPDAAFRQRLLVAVDAALDALDEGSSLTSGPAPGELASDGRPAALGLDGVDPTDTIDGVDPTDTSGGKGQLVTVTMEAATRRRARSRTRWLIAGAVAAVIALVVAVLVAREDDGSSVDIINTPSSTAPAGPSSTTGPPPSASSGVDLPPIEAPESAGARSFAAPHLSGTIAVDGDSVWISPDSGPLQRYDGEGHLLATVAVQNGSIAQRPVFAFGSLWVTTELDDTLWRIDPASGQVVASVAIRPDVRGAEYVNLSTVAATEDAVWVVSFDRAAGGTNLIRVDPATNAVVGSIPAPASAANVIYAEGSFWVLSSEGPLQRVSPADGRVEASFPIQEPFNTELRAGLGSIWTDDIVDGVEMIIRIDPATNAVSARIPLGPPAGYYVRSDMAFAAGFLWTSSTEALLIKIDPATNAVVARYGKSASGAGVAASDDTVWFSDWSGRTLYRLPAR